MIILNIQIILKREDLLVCIKPPGIVSESAGLPSLLIRQEGIPVLFPVHRLDQNTGGLIVLARNKQTCARMADAFSSHKAEKTYLAVVSSEHMDSSGHFEDLLYHDRTHNKTYVVRSLRKGVKKASCTWKLLDTVNTEHGLLHLVRISLHTGRTHQIRIQFSSRRMPLVGDLRYGSRIKARFPALWACGLSFPDPSDPEKKLSFQIPLPDSWPWNIFSPDDPADGSDDCVLP